MAGHINYGPWAKNVSARYDGNCVACGHHGWCQHDHIWPLSQARKDPRRLSVLNGATLCGDFCRHCEAEGKKPCHLQKTHGELRYQFRWLRPDTIVYLADVGWVAWNPVTGEPYGPGMNHFEPLPDRYKVPIVLNALPKLVRDDFRSARGRR